MKLSEKIYTCRKRQGLSQEKLAEQLGVSRQAVSKWETGDSEPEIGKLLLLARTFGVTVDWLLSDETQEEADAPKAPPQHDWVESLPGVLGRLIRRYGWLAGVYLAVTGCGFLFMGGLARYLSNRMMREALGGFWDQGGFGTAVIGEGGAFFAPGSNPVTIMGGAMMILGGILAAAGIVLAIVLKKKSREE